MQITERNWRFAILLYRMLCCVQTEIVILILKATCVNFKENSWKLNSLYSLYVVVSISHKMCCTMFLGKSHRHRRPKKKIMQLLHIYFQPSRKYKKNRSLNSLYKDVLVYLFQQIVIAIRTRHKWWKIKFHLFNLRVCNIILFSDNQIQFA